MDTQQIIKSRTGTLYLGVLVLALLWTAGLTASLLWNIQVRQEDTVHEAKREVYAYLNKDMLFRNWVADRSGIYLPTDENTPVDTILSAAEDGDITTPGGKRLTWASHAFVTRNLHRLSQEKLKVYGRLVSTQPLSGEDEPDAWERHALQHFRKGASEAIDLSPIDGVPYLRVMQPIFTEKACLQCHSNYKVGSIRGGISASIPMEPYYAQEHKDILAYIYTHTGVWLVGLLGIGAATLRISKQTLELDIAEKTLIRESEERFHKFSAAAQDAILFMDSRGDIAYWNQAAEKILGYSAEEAIGKSLHSLLAPNRFHDAFNEAFPEFLQTGEGAIVGKITELSALRRDGAEIPIELSLSASRIGNEWYGLGILRDITERKQAQAAIERSLNIQRVLDAILNLSLPPLTFKEILSRSLDAILSIPAFALLNKGSIFLITEDGEHLELAAHRNLPDDLAQQCAMLPFGKGLCGRAAQTREIVFAKGLDERHEIGYEGMQPHGYYCIPVMSEGRLLGMLNVYVTSEHKTSKDERHQLKTIADTLAMVIERKRDEETLKHMAHHDHLTGLPNRMVFYDRMDQSLAMARRHKTQLAVLFLDLDHFKDVNDERGHDAGDELLKEAATRLLDSTREMDTVARIGGDEFTIILTAIDGAESARLVAEKIQKTLSRTFGLADRGYRISTSIGIAMYPADGEDSETLVKNADSAMYHAKRERNSPRFFSECA